MSTADLIDNDVEELAETILEEASEPILAVNPSKQELEALITVTTESDEDIPELRVISEPMVLKEMVNDFIIASKAADLVDQEKLSLRTSEEIRRNSMLVTEDEVVSLITMDGEVNGLRSDESEFVDHARETFMNAWENASEFSLRTPPLSQVKETLREEIGDDTADDFGAVLESVETIEADGTDEVVISLMIAARNNILLYDISKWGEDVGVASKATFSRTKTRLEDLGLIDTEKVPIDVGRPRLRLQLGDESMADMDPDEMIEETESEITA